MGLQEQLMEDMKAAMKSGDKPTVETLRLIRSQVKNVAISKGEDLSDDDVISVLTKEAKKRKESIELYKKGGRDELAESEEKELGIIQSYLPEAISEEELSQIVQSAIEESGAESMKEMGKVMGFVMPQVKGRADGKAVREMVKQKLS